MTHPSDRLFAARLSTALPILVHSRFWRYGLIGAIATGAHYALLAALVEATRLSPGPAATLAAGVGAAVAYLLNRRFTFDVTVPHRQALPRFLFTATLGAAGNGLVVWGASTAWGWHYLVAQALATVMLVVLTYQLNRRWTFARI